MLRGTVTKELNAKLIDQGAGWEYRWAVRWPGGFELKAYTFESAERLAQMQEHEARDWFERGARRFYDAMRIPALNGSGPTRH